VKKGSNKMKLIKASSIVLCALFACAFLLPTAAADEWNNRTTVTFSAPVEVPGVGAPILPAGTYLFKLMDSPSDRNIVQIFNEDGTHLYTTVLAIPNYRLRVTDFNGPHRHNRPGTHGLRTCLSVSCSDRILAMTHTMRS
jgi:hypothetical protein